MKCGVFFFVLAATIPTIFGQTQSIDSLTRQLDKVEDKKKVDLLNRLTFEFISQDNDKAKQYCDQSLELCKKIGYTKGEGVAYTYRGIFEYLAGEYSDGRTSLRHGLRLAIQSKDIQNQ